MQQLKRFAPHVLRSPVYCTQPCFSRCTGRGCRPFSGPQQEGNGESVADNEPEGGKPLWTVEDVKARQSKAVRAWLDKQVGAEKLELAKLLQEHAVIVRGGPEHAQSLMDALIVRAVAASSC